MGWLREAEGKIALGAARCGMLSYFAIIYLDGLGMPTAIAADDSKQLLKSCRDNAGDWDRAFCYGFTKGASLTLYDQKVICPPEGVTSGGVIDQVTKYLLANPQAQNRSPSKVVRVALIDAFPCNGT